MQISENCHRQVKMDQLNLQKCLLVPITNRREEKEEESQWTTKKWMNSVESRGDANITAVLTVVKGNMTIRTMTVKMTATMIATRAEDEEVILRKTEDIIAAREVGTLVEADPLEAEAVHEVIAQSSVM